MYFRHPLASLSFISTTLLHLTCKGQSTNNDLGAFEHPSTAFRPRFRYWLPDASVDGDVVKADIVAAASIGAGGVEFLPYYNYGGGYGGPPAGVNWSTYGFGTPPYLNVFRSAMEGHRDTGTLMDFPLGPNQAQGVPAARDDEGLQWDLVPFSTIVPANGTFNGVIPGWGTGDLIALVSAHVLLESTISTFTPNISPETFPAILPNSSFAQAQQAATPLQIIIQDGSLQDVTTIVSPNGTATFSAPTNGTGLYYRLFAFYQRRTLNKNVSFQSNRSANIWDDGSYNVDHFSSRGAETVTDFWDKYILVDGLEDLLKQVGNYGWEDSVEITSTVTWTPSLPAKFEAKFGYPIHAYLPMMIYQQNNLLFQSNDPGEFQCLLNTPDKGVGYSNDYRGAIQDGYRDYLQALKNWTNNRLGKDYSAQPGYNLPLDMTSGIPVVDIPECESLSFHSNVDVYRQFVGSANLAGRNLISNEMGAEGNRAYSLYMTDLQSSINYAIAGGVNKFVIHGQPYSGNYPGTTWPGYTAFSYAYSEQWSPKQPSWENGLSDLMGYISRLGYIQQLGVPLTDVALFNKPSATDPRLPPLYTPTDLVGVGWSYTYLSPENFYLPNAYAKNGILAPDGPAWQAIAIQSNQNLSVDAVNHLQDFAAAGVPIVISGGTPGYYSSGNDSSEPLFDKELASLLSMSNVYQVATGGIASKLSSIGLKPRAQYSANGTWYTTFRSDSETDYVFVLNDSPNATVGEVIVQSAKTPYFLDAWTGQKVPTLVYNSSSEATTIQLKLAGKQGKLIAFQDPSGSDDPACHVTSTDANILGSNYSQTSKSISLHATSAGQAAFSNGKIQSLNSSKIAQPIVLSNWTLVAEHWERPSDIYDAGVIAVKRNTTHQLSSLTSWLNIPALASVSGVGYYASTFTWPTNSSASGAYISLPSILHGGRAYINGKQIPPFDYFGASKDITQFLKEGSNEVRVIVPTIMWNYIRTFFDQVQTPGIDNTRGQVEGLPGLDNGLIGEVVVVPFWEVVVQC